MIVVHFTKVASCTPWVVISSLAKRLWKPPFSILYTSFGVWPRDHYMMLQRSTTRVCHALLWFPEEMVPACCAMVSRTNVPSCTMWFRKFTKYVTKTDHKVWCHPHSTEHDTQPIAYLISKQAVPCRTCGGTCCPGVSIPKIHSLANLSMTDHITDGIQPSPPFWPCSNHCIDPHHSQITSRQMGDHLSQRHKPNSSSQRMEGLVRLSWLHG
jgi:hypothetical protein